MLELALADLPGLLLDTREVRRAAQGGAPSYTVDTLHEVRAQLGPATPVAWLLGADAFVGLPGWHEWTELFGLAHLVIAARPGTALDLADAPVLAQAVQGRYEEIFEMVQAELRRSGFEELVRAGMVLTGGASKMEGVVELAEEMLQMPVRVGIPQHVTGLGEVVGNPVHASGVGLLLMGSQIEHPRRPSIPTGRAGSLFKKLKNWYRGEF